MTDPVKALQIVKQRLARLAALRALTASVPPIIVLVGAALGWRALGYETWERWGFMLAPQAARHMQIAILAATVIALAAAAIAALISFTRSEDTAAAAELVDLKLGSHEEVLTLATLATCGPMSAAVGATSTEALNGLPACAASAF